jgi:NAD(P)-dependent dehydrogenase (short-subunit alcohol dehydrogenase family)
MDIFKDTLFKDKVILITGGSRGGMLKDTGRAYL